MSTIKSNLRPWGWFSQPACPCHPESVDPSDLICKDFHHAEVQSQAYWHLLQCLQSLTQSDNSALASIRTHQKRDHKHVKQSVRSPFQFVLATSMSFEASKDPEASNLTILLQFARIGFIKPSDWLMQFNCSIVVCEFRKGLFSQSSFEFQASL